MAKGVLLGVGFAGHASNGEVIAGAVDPLTAILDSLFVLLRPDFAPSLVLESSFVGRPSLAMTVGCCSLRGLSRSWINRIPLVRVATRLIDKD